MRGKLTWALERHRYAPELNRIHVLRGGRLVQIVEAPGVDSLDRAETYLIEGGILAG